MLCKCGNKVENASASICWPCRAFLRWLKKEQRKTEIKWRRKTKHSCEAPI